MRNVKNMDSHMETWILAWCIGTRVSISFGSLVGMPVTGTRLGWCI